MANESDEFCLPLGSLLLLGDRTKQVNKQNPDGCRWAGEGALEWLGGVYMHHVCLPLCVPLEPARRDVSLTDLRNLPETQLH